MKIIFLTFFLTGVAVGSFSQNYNGRGSAAASPISIGIEAGVPIGENGKPYAVILGASLQYEYRPAADLGITFSAGYLNYSIKSSLGGSSIGFVPLLPGFKYYFKPGAFFHGQLGAAVGTRHGQGTSFAYSPGIGFAITPQLNLEFKYMGISNGGGTLSDVGVRLGYEF